MILSSIIGSKHYKCSRENVGCNFPTVSMVIAAYNEENVIEDKLINCQNIEYPKDKIEFLIGSDGSTDKTNDIVYRYAQENDRIQLHSFSERRGKATVLNNTILKANGEIVVFSDANTIYQINAISELVAPFLCTDIGCVCGKLIITKPSLSTSNDDLYWKYENWIKTLENRLGGVLGANGGIYAIRKHLFIPIPENTIIDDFIIGMKICEQGYRIYYAENAIANEETAENDRAEFKRRVRIGAGNFQSIAILKKLLLPEKGLFAFQFWSHKIIRWHVPFMLLIFLITSGFMISESAFFAVVFVLQLLFYGFSIVGFSVRDIRNPVFRIPAFFTSMNLAFLLGFYRFLFKTQKVTWERTERLSRV